MNEKIQKVLANAGVGSRRQIEQWIKEGRITINKRLAVIGERIDDEAKIQIDGREINLAKSQDKKRRVLMYHKPDDQLCTRNDPEGRATIFESLPSIRNGRWITVGRLDLNTSGLLLVTTDGELAHKLMHPSTQIAREYAVRLRGEVTPEIFTNLKKGVELEDGLAHFETLEDAGGAGSNHWYHVTVREGRNRLVRRLFESQNLQVSRLIRVRFGALTLPPYLARGKWLELDEETIEEFMTSLSVPPTRPIKIKSKTRKYQKR